MEFLKFKATSDDDGRRFDKVALRLLEEKKSGDVFKAIRKGLIKLNEKKARSDAKVKEGDVIEVAEFLTDVSTTLNMTKRCHPDVTTPCHPEQSRRIFLTENLEILFKNENFLIINKPFNISTQGGNKNATSLDEIVREKYGKTDSLSFKVGPLHRIDKMTTGVLVFSQSLSGAKWFSEKIKSHEIKKTYLGIAEGNLEKKETWTDEIDGKDATTIATPLKTGEYKKTPVTLVEYKIPTGRKHQIRLHSEKHGHPLLGDSLHGSTLSTDDGGFFLHAIKMEVPENNLGLPKKIEAPPPERFNEFINGI